MARILKRGTIWYMDVIYKGKRIRRSLKTSSRKVAELALKNFEIQAAKEELNIAGPKKITFSEFSTRFLSWYEVQNSNKSSRDYVNLFNSTLIPYFKDYLIKDISTEMVENYKVYRAQSVKPPSVNKDLTALKHFFNKAITSSSLTCWNIW